MFNIASSLRTLRVRLTLWYILLLGLTLLVCSALLYFQLENGLLAQVDNTLQRAVERCTALTSDAPMIKHCFSETGMTVRLELPNARGWTVAGDEHSHLLWPSPKLGTLTVYSEQDSWRVLGRTWAGGWLQVAQSLAPEQKLLASQQEQTLLRLPLVLLLAGLGGLFLASRALNPIDRIRRTAEAIGAGALTSRISHRGPSDEVGKLAAAFDGMLDRLQAAFEREKRFTADVSHELRTPLSVLKGRIEVTLSRSRSQQEYTDTLQEMGRTVERLSRLTNDLLFLARFDQGSSHWQPAIVNLNDLLEAVIEQAEPLAVTKQIQLVEEVTPELRVKGETDYLISLFLNILDNAIKYTSISGKVTIRATHSHSMIRVEFIDTGIGITQEHLLHVFERFYRVDASRSSNGAGLGLAIANEIVKLHGGFIEVESALGRGSTFIVCLPNATPSTILQKHALLKPLSTS